MSIAVVMATGNEESMLRPCLELLGWADEIVLVIDARSSDATEEIAREFTDKVYVREFDTFSGQRNYGISKSSADWVLVVDADERVTPALAEEILEVTADPGDHVAYHAVQSLFAFGRLFRHGGSRAPNVRLIRRSHARYSGDIHETFQFEGRAGMLREELWHFTHRDIAGLLRKTIVFGELQAQEMLEARHPDVTVRSLVRAPMKALRYRMITHRAFLDGIEGTIDALYLAFWRFCEQVMLWEKQRAPSLESTYAELERAAREHHRPGSA